MFYNRTQLGIKLNVSPITYATFSVASPPEVMLTRSRFCAKLNAKIDVKTSNNSNFFICKKLIVNKIYLI